MEGSPSSSWLNTIHYIFIIICYIICINNIFFIHSSSAHRHRGCFYILATVSNATWLWECRYLFEILISFFFFGYIPRSRIAKSHGSLQLLGCVWLFVTPMDCSTPGYPIHHQLLELTQTHVHWVSGAIQRSHVLSSPSPPTFNPLQHQGLFKWVNSSHEVAKVLEFQLQHQSFQWIFRIDFL